MKQVVATVKSNEKLWGEYWLHGYQKYLGTWLIWLNCPEMTSEAKPGQFVMVNCGEECLLPRPLSVHQVNAEGDIALFFAALGSGKGTRWLSQRRSGDSVRLLGALGNGFSIEPATKSLLLVAGGNGIAPLYFLADEALKKGCSVTLLYGTADEKRYPENFFPAKVKLVAATENGTAGYHGRITDLIAKFADGVDQVFACGPAPMYRAMAVMPELKDKPVQISLEVRMGCGRGVCYGCTVKTKTGLKQVCQDGPVFDLNDIIWDELT